MPVPSIQSIDDYESFIQSELAELTTGQRAAFCAAMAERYLPVYNAFSKIEDWGDPAAMRRGLDAIWEHLQGYKLSSRDIDRHIGLVRDGTPHMDDFDAEEALAAAMLVSEALESCRTGDNIAAAVQAAYSGFEAVMPGWSDDPREQPRLWQKSAVRREFSQQVWFLDQVHGMTRFDEASVKALRRVAASTEHAGKIPKRKEPSMPPSLTNQALFEQYRRMMELDLKTADKGWEKMDMKPALSAMRLLGHWMARYSRRMQTIDGSYGAPADTIAQRALIARNKAVDRASPGNPVWAPDFGMMIEMMYNNPYNNLGLKAIDEAHGYGPSIRRLWVEAKKKGLSDDESAEQVRAWAFHRPPAWEVEDRRKKKGLAYSTMELGDLLAQRVRWESTADPIHPWMAQVEDREWKIRINDFPDDYMYTLLLNREVLGSFHDWPETWERED